MILKAWAIINGKGEYYYGGPHDQWRKDRAQVFWTDPSSMADAMGDKAVELAIIRTVKGGEVGEDQEA